MSSTTSVAERNNHSAHDRFFLASCAMLFFLSAAGTVYLCRSMSEGMEMPGGWTMSMTWTRMAAQSWTNAAISFLAMWLVMMIAMMLPSVVPVLANYRRSIRNSASSRLGLLTIIVGSSYFFVWLVIGAVLYPLGVGLAASEMNWPALGKSVPFAVGIVVVLAGCLQFTAWKTRQLGLCRVSTICDRNLPTDSKSAVEYGLRLGVHCVFCCAGFMAILLVAGLMDLRVMAAVTVGITVERVVSRSGRFAFVTGVLAIVAGIVLMARAFGLS